MLSKKVDHAVLQLANGTVYRSRVVRLLLVRLLYSHVHAVGGVDVLDQRFLQRVLNPTSLAFERSLVTVTLHMSFEFVLVVLDETAYFAQVLDSFGSRR